MTSGAALFVTLIVGAAAGADGLAPDVSAWLKSRAEDYQAHFGLEKKGGAPDLLWRERPRDLPLPEFSPPTSLAPLVRKVRPAVVNISTVNQASSTPIGGLSLGSGFIISPEGFVVTNNHLVERAQQIRVQLADGRQFYAEVVGRDPSTDLALLRLLGELGQLPLVYLGDSDKLEVGDWVIAIGNPFGLDYSVAQGIISAKERVLGVGDFDDFLQTDALINPGNSGGPLFNMRGEVVGVNTAIASQGQGIGFAVPINMVKDLLPNLRVNGHLARGWLGVNISEGAVGAVMKDVYPDSPAAQAGLKAGDRVTAVNGRSIETYLQLLRGVALFAPGSEVKLTVVRDGKVHEKMVKLGQRPASDQMPNPSAMAAPGPLGLLLRDLTPELAQRANAAPFSGLWVLGVVPDSSADRAGLRPGDVVIEVNKQRVMDLGGYRTLLARSDPNQPVLLRFQRGSQSRYVAVGP